MSFHVPAHKRLEEGPLKSSAKDGNNGAFAFWVGSTRFFVIASDGMGWEHVSVSTQDRTPTWAEMCAIKALFWDEEDTVVQFHPPLSRYVNVHPHCLHLWRKTDSEFETPPNWMVGPTRGRK